MICIRRPELPHLRARERGDVLPIPKMTWPLVGSSSLRATQRPSVDFPQPDSPTSPSVSPRRILKLTPETACTLATSRPSTPPRIGKRLCTSRTESSTRSGGLRSSAVFVTGPSRAGRSRTQRMRCGASTRPPIFRSSGSTLRQSSPTNEQRSWKRHPSGSSEQIRHDSRDCFKLLAFPRPLPRLLTGDPN